MNLNWSYSLETLNSGHNWWFLSCLTLKFDGGSWKTIRHLFYATSSFVHSFVAISPFKLELQCRNARFGSKSTIFWATWPWNLMDDIETGIRHHVLCYFQLCASFQSHQWIQTGVTVRKRPIGSKSAIFLSHVTLIFEKTTTTGHLFYATSSFVHHFVAIGELKLELQSGNAQFGSKSMNFSAMWPWNLIDDPEKQ